MLYKGSLINTQESEAAQTSLLKEEIFGQRGSFLSFFKQEKKSCHLQPSMESPTLWCLPKTSKKSQCSGKGCSSLQ